MFFKEAGVFDLKSGQTFAKCLLIKANLPVFEFMPVHSLRSGVCAALLSEQSISQAKYLLL